MNMEVLIGSAIALGSMYIAEKYEPLETKKIKHTFRNINYKVGDYEPKLIRIRRSKNWKEYVFNVPYGLVDDPKLQPIFSKTLAKPVHVYFDGKLHIRVYKNKIPKSVEYDLFESKGGWEIPVGMAADGPVYHDFGKIPHMTIAGATTWGKTVFMKTLMTHLIENNPDGAEFYILDLKGGLAFERYSKLKQVKAIARDHKESAETLSEVMNCIKSDMDYFREIKAENAKDAGIKVRKFILIDEAGELIPFKGMSETDINHTKKCQRALSYIARISGQLGYSLLFATQYPTAEIMNNQIKANALAKVSFRLSTSIQSNVAVDESGAEKLEYPGRAIYRTVNTHVVQTPFITNEKIWEKIGRYEEYGANSPTAEMGTERRTDIVHFG